MGDEVAKSFTREELQALRERADTHAKHVPNPHWKRAYINISEAVDYLDAMIARTEWRE